MSGFRSSVRFPSLILPICEIDPKGLPNPLLVAITPAIKVVETAPMPGVKIPNLPDGFLMFCDEFILIYFNYKIINALHFLSTMIEALKCRKVGKYRQDENRDSEY